MFDLNPTLAALLIGWALTSALMAVLWALHLATRNAGLVDVGWAFGLAILAVWFAASGSSAIGAVSPDSASALRVWLMAGMVVVWGVRLGGYILFTRIVGRPEDARYVAMRDEWQGTASRRFFWFFQTQALLDVLLSVPTIVVARSVGPVGPTEIAAVVLWLTAMTGEITADWQLAAFKRDPRHRGQVCDVGLWRYSRHPNYFFEFMIWVSFALYASNAAFGWLAWTAPAMMLYFLGRVTGIPLAEAQSLRSRGDAYREYQRRTSVFVPWFRR
ncbi:MAG: DUF1295 domain-containing protein [Acidobacteriota bacterium]